MEYGAYGNGANAQRRNPPADVDDALQFTPLSSVVPFAAESLPLPTLKTTGTLHTFSDHGEQEQARHTLNSLNSQAEADPNSPIVGRYLGDIASYLNSEELTEYRFKSVMGIKKGSQSNANEVSQTSLDFLKHPRIGKFGNMVLKKTDPHYKAGPPSNVAIRSKPATSVSSQENLKTSSQLNKHPSVHTSSFAVEVTTPSRSKTLSQTPQPKPESGQQTPGGSQPVAAIVIPVPPPRFDPSQYASHVELDHRMRQSKSTVVAATSKSRKRKRASSEGDDEPMAAGIDQRAKADSHVRSLEVLISGIFEAEDNLQPDTSDRAVDKASKYWTSSTVDSDSPCLSAAVQVKLENSIHRVIAVGRFASIPVEDLARIQKLCENTLRLAEETRIRVDEESFGDETSIDAWLSRVNIVDNGLKTAKSVLRMMVGGREEKQIYNEDILQAVLTNLKSLLNDCINPLIELRPSEKPEIFKGAASHKKVLGGLLHEITNVFALLSLLISSEDVPETAVTTMEFLAKDIIFIDNASNEKDSVLGAQKVERFRVAAMDILAKIFARYEDQRMFIFDEILTSLEKLPVNRQSARQFKLVEGGKNIQLVSALMMTLVQTSAAYSPLKKSRSLDAIGEDGELLYVGDKKSHDKAMDDDFDESNPQKAIDKLRSLCSNLNDTAKANAKYLVQFLVQRAMKSTKTGDAPYRHLMDIFTEDFLAVLQSPEWPGADLLLEQILRSMINIVDGEKQPAPAKTMALDLLGLMGSTICDINVHMKNFYASKESLDAFDSHMASITERYFSTQGGGEDVVDWESPHRFAAEYLAEQNIQNESLQSSLGYFLVSWGTKLCAAFDKLEEEEIQDESGVRLSLTAFNLARMLTDSNWAADDDFDPSSISSVQVRQAYTLTVMHNAFCKSFEPIVTRLLRAIDSDQATIRSKGLKSIMQLLQKDPTILNRPNVLRFFKSKAQDQSPLVRDSVIDLLGKCITLRPDLESDLYEHIKLGIADVAVGVRKRAMKLCKDIYLRTDEESIRISIARALMTRIKDIDSAVAELARKTFEEIWITPLYPYVENTDEKEISPKAKQLVNERLSIMIKVIHGTGNDRGLDNFTLSILQNLIQSLLAKDVKNLEVNLRVCKAMVGSMFDDLLDRQSDTDKVERQNTLQALAVFARANARLFTPEQLIILQPYTENLATIDDLLVFRSVIVIYRYALPALGTSQTPFLEKVQQSLLRCLSRITAKELHEVVQCLWTINGVLKNIERLVRVTISCIKIIHNAKTTDEKEINKLNRSINILGLIGMECDFEDDKEKFDELRAPKGKWKGGSIAGLIADTIIPFTASKQPLVIRKRALESLGDVCQTHAPLFLEPRILAAFDNVFAENNPDLEEIVLAGFRGFLLIEEKRSETSMEEETKGERASRLEVAAVPNQNDGVCTSIAQKYLKEIIRIALGTLDHYAITAVEVIGSICRQGLVHPKECIPTLIALQTSTNTSIQTLSFTELRTLHNKHESIAERCYLDGLKQCFLYQFNVIKDGCGATAQPFVSKLRPMYDIVKASRKARKKFLSVLTSSLSFEPAKFELNSSPGHLELTRFIVENLAFMEYSTVEELMQVISDMERSVASMGVPVAHSVETEIFLIGKEEGTTVDPERLKTLSNASAILLLIWETRSYLRKLYGFGVQRKGGKISAKDATTKAPTKAPFVTGAPLWEQIKQIVASLDLEDGMMQRCRDFVEVMNIDKDMKLIGDSEDDLDAPPDPITPERSDGEEPATLMKSLTPSKRKRKIPATPSKERGQKKKPYKPRAKKAT
ncbi:sister chromatid cohesion C-terminus-domain-containing protein [Kalaharituber pfeilii]|nr:sister chromatid cohesion C-terminus-domain-containing protein [Kalaharituber pfeilii]